MEVINQNESQGDVLLQGMEPTDTSTFASSLLFSSSLSSSVSLLESSIQLLPSSSESSSLLPWQFLFPNSGATIFNISLKASCSSDMQGTRIWALHLGFVWLRSSTLTFTFGSAPKTGLFSSDAGTPLIQDLPPPRSLVATWLAT